MRRAGLIGAAAIVLLSQGCDTLRSPTANQDDAASLAKSSVNLTCEIAILGDHHAYTFREITFPMPAAAQSGTSATTEVFVRYWKVGTALPTRAIACDLPATNLATTWFHARFESKTQQERDVARQMANDAEVRHVRRANASFSRSATMNISTDDDVDAIDLNDCPAMTARAPNSANFSLNCPSYGPTITSDSVTEGDAPGDPPVTDSIGTRDTEGDGDPELRAFVVAAIHNVYKTDDPHKSTTTPGTVIVKGWTTSTIIEDLISTTTVLRHQRCMFRGHFCLWDSTLPAVFAAPFAAYAEARATQDYCENGYYYGTSKHFASTYHVTPNLNVNTWSRTVYITC
jgi:hypothetical protein